MHILSLFAFAAFFPIASEDLLMRETQEVALTCSLWSNSPEAQQSCVENILIEYEIDPASIRAKIARRYLSHFLNAFNAYIVSESVAPQCHATVERLCKKMGIQKPIIALSPLLNNAAARSLPGMPSLIVLGAAYMSKLSDAECEAVIAHELGHIKENHFTQFVATSTLLTAGVIIPFNIYCRLWLHTKYSNPLVIREGLLNFARNLVKDTSVITAATVAVHLSVLFLLMKISRADEYAADKQAAETLGSIEALVSWLERENDATHLIAQWSAESANPENAWYTRLQYTARVWLTKNFITHPLNEERIAALRAAESAN